MVPSRAMRNFSKFQVMSPLGAGLVSTVVRYLIEGRDVVALDADFGEHGESHIVFCGAECFDLEVGAGFLGAEVVGGEAEDGEAFVLVFGVHGFEAGVLGGVAALAGDIDDEEDFAGVLGEVDIFAVDVVHGEVEGGGFGGGCGAVGGFQDAGCEGGGDRRGEGEDGEAHHGELLKEVRTG